VSSSSVRVPWLGPWVGAVCVGGCGWVCVGGCTPTCVFVHAHVCVCMCVCVGGCVLVCICVWVGGYLCMGVRTQQDETWTKFSNLEVAMCVPCS
jgi:hypothetical protein